LQTRLPLGCENRGGINGKADHRDENQLRETTKLEARRHDPV
jgi:hypothetical protein